MAQPPLQFPSEVWTHIFEYLSVADKFSVRASCKYFKKLIDHWSVWRDWTVVLGFKNGSYNSQLWATLRRRRVTSVVMRSLKVKDWKQLSLSLPNVTTVVMDQSTNENFTCLKHFPHLKRLALRGSCTPLWLDASTMSGLELLSHLNICGVRLSNASQGQFVTVTPNLTSLVLHEVKPSGETIRNIQVLLFLLPHLKHLSVSAEHEVSGCRSFLNQRDPSIEGLPEPIYTPPYPNLLSLEIIDFMDYSLPKAAMMLTPGLNSLALFYRHSHHEMPEAWSSPVCRLNTWLCGLPHLSTLVIVKGPPVKMYVTSIPASVTTLTLCVAGLSSEDLAAIAVQVPNLLHLHIDPMPSHLGAHTAEIPELFPNLKSLKLRHEHVPEEDFLHLHQLQDLEYLEILDNHQPRVSELIGKLQALTEFRLQIATSPRQRDILSCYCVHQVY